MPNNSKTSLPGAAILRHSHGLCPVCLHAVPAEVRETDGSIWLIKTCEQHGETRALLSEHPAFFRDVHDFYFDVLPDRLPQRDFILRMTERCNLDCPICLAGANQDVLPDYSVAEISRLLAGMKGKKIDLMGCEPTVVPHLPEIIRLIRKSGNIAALHSNGIALADRGYLQALKDAGLDEVHLQFDGFDDEAYRIIRGRPLLDTKLKAMDNLTDLDIPVDLVMTILAGVNDKEISALLDYGVRRKNVKEIFFLGCRMLGKAVGHFEKEQLMPDQVVDMVERATNGRVSREHVRRMQKLYFTFLSIFGVRKCLYVQHYLLFRNKAADNYTTLDEVVDMARLEPCLERYRSRHSSGKFSAALRLALEAAPLFLRPRPMRLMGDLFALNLMMALGFNLRRARRSSILLGYITACDPHIFDTAIADLCGKGEISRDLGFQESGARANTLREHRWRNA